MERYNYIAVEGAIGSGKTILVEALARRLGAEKIELSPEENPFLQDFYRNPERFAFQTQLFFLLERHKLMLRLFEIDLFHQVVVSDFVFERDRLYAS
ncbi:MAG TPA: deoxynucleoside kinase, partial [candidate division Zixibacteria bacterium]|nr:deoxynucleoside kinase [candidate division Zixibacteria bacterium]